MLNINLYFEKCNRVYFPKFSSGKKITLVFLYFLFVLLLSLLLLLLNNETLIVLNLATSRSNYSSRVFLLLEYIILNAAICNALIS